LFLNFFLIFNFLKKNIFFNFQFFKNLIFLIFNFLKKLIFFNFQFFLIFIFIKFSIFFKFNFFCVVYNLSFVHFAENFESKLQYFTIRCSYICHKLSIDSPCTYATCNINDLTAPPTCFQQISKHFSATIFIVKDIKKSTILN